MQVDTSLYVGVTDADWYRQLHAERPDEVNFWKPGGRRAFRAVRPGAPFLFKLHYPANAIVGGGFFVRFAFLPVSLAWRAFERKNGREYYRFDGQRLANLPRARAEQPEVSFLAWHNEKVYEVGG